MIPLDPKHIAALIAIKASLGALQNATPTAPAVVTILVSHVDAELMSFYELVLGITPAK